MVLGVSGTLFFSLNLQHPVVLAPKHVSADTQTVQPTSAVKSLGRSVPTHISIPKIQLDAQILPTGLSSTGSIQVPDNPWATGWFTNSPTPGEVGPSVIVGHVDWINNIAVFWRLRELAPGDTVAITREDGSTAKFTITQIAQYAQDQFPTQAVYGNINYPGLRLITCGGTFDTSTRHYNQNTVVYAVLTS
jgi:sortase (surface protein transpeptidase)